VEPEGKENSPILAGSGRWVELTEGIRQGPGRRAVRRPPTPRQSGRWCPCQAGPRGPGATCRLALPPPGAGEGAGPQVTCWQEGEPRGAAATAGRPRADSHEGAEVSWGEWAGPRELSLLSLGRHMLPPLAGRTAVPVQNVTPGRLAGQSWYLHVRPPAAADLWSSRLIRGAYSPPET
jgi:hypothetical protein